MNKKTKKKWLIATPIVLVLIFSVLYFTDMLPTGAGMTEPCTYAELDGFKTPFNSCHDSDSGSSGMSAVTGCGTEQPLNLESNCNLKGSSSCGGSRTASAEFEITDLSTVESIYIELGGSTSTTAHQDMQSRISFNFYQQSGAIVSGQKFEIGYHGVQESSFPAGGILINFDGEFVTIPALQTSKKINLQEPLKLRFDASIPQCGATRNGATAKININDITVTRTEPDITCGAEGCEEPDIPCVGDDCKKSLTPFIVIGSIVLILGGLIAYLVMKK